MAIGTPEQAIQAAEQQLKELSSESRRCVETTALFWEYILSYEQYREQQSGFSESIS
jgi:hypothetical protein